MIEYKLISAFSDMSLSERINEQILNGFVISGDPSCSVTLNGTFVQGLFIQAMVREIE